MPLEYEEHHEMSGFRSWMVILLFCAAIVLWGVLNYVLIPDEPRHWDMGALRDVPGQSIYSSAKLPAGAVVPKQMEPLP